VYALGVWIVLMYWVVWVAVATSVNVLMVGIGCVESTYVLGCVGSCCYQC
jgi:hypothetical protein